MDVRTGVGVGSFEGSSELEAVRLSDGNRIECDFAVVGVGVMPRTDLAERAGLDVQNGIRVDERLEASVPGIFAAGDVANARHPIFGPIRIEHWANALNQGPAAARNMLGAEHPYDRVPYFFSDQYDLGLEYSGFASGADRVVFRGDLESREFIAFWLSDGRVAAGMNVNTWGVSEAIQSLVRGQLEVDVEHLTNPAFPLEDLGTERPTRGRPKRSAREFLRQGPTFSKRFAAARFGRADKTPASELGPGEARVLQMDGQKAACYRDDSGDLHAVSAVCTHMGCLIDWSDADKTWDCPCHGSRFDSDGRVIQGPAKKPLEEVHVAATEKAAATTRESA